MGLRTPAKKANPTDSLDLERNQASQAGPSERRSIEELEAGRPKTVPTPKTPSPPKKTVLTYPPKVKPTTTSLQESKPEAAKRQESVGAAKKETSLLSPKSPPRSPPKPQYANRSAEARACLNKAKLHLSSSRNTKNEIKYIIVEVLDRLFQLVKEAEREAKSKSAGGTQEIIQPKAAAIDAALSINADKNSHSTNQETSQLMERIEEHSKLLLESNKRMEELKGIIETQYERNDKVETPTYAGVAGSGSRGALEKRTLHSVVVTSSNEEDSGEEVLDKVRKAIDAKEGWIKVEKVRKAKDRKVIMGFETTEERDKVKERLRKNGASLTVEEVKNKDPMLILKSVLLVNTDEDVLKAFRNQNQDVFHGLSGGMAKVEIKYRRRTRNPHTGHIVLSVSPDIWKRVTAKGYVHIDLQRIRAEDQTPLMQCTRCLGFGHSKKYCEQSVDMCSHCGGPHLRSECADFITGVPPKCQNCTKAKLGDADHNAFSFECPTRRKWDEIARSTVAYC